MGKKNKASMIEKLPEELVIDILSRAAASSLLDISNVKLSCKKLNEYAKNSDVYRSACLEQFPIDPSTPLNYKQQKFLRKCRESGNPELLYRDALTDMESACEKLEAAMKSGHVGAFYVRWFVLIHSSDAEERESGVRLLGEMKKSMKKREWRLRRAKLIDELKQMWLIHWVLMKPQVCSSTHRPWAVECQACAAQAQLRFIYSKMI